MRGDTWCETQWVVPKYLRSYVYNLAMKLGDGTHSTSTIHARSQLANNNSWYFMPSFIIRHHVMLVACISNNIYKSSILGSIPMSSSASHIQWRSQGTTLISTTWWWRIERVDHPLCWNMQTHNSQLNPMPQNPTLGCNALPNSHKHTLNLNL